MKTSYWLSAMPFALLSGTVLPAHAETDPPHSIDLDTIVVTGSRTAMTLADSVVDVDVISAADIARSGATNVAESLLHSSAIKLTPTGALNPGIEVQGFDSEHVLVLINGRRLNGRVEGSVDLRRISASNIQQIEIVRGPSSALYGSDALGGVINIITEQDPEIRKIQGKVNTLGSYELTAHAGTAIGEDGTATGVFGYSHTEAFDLDESDSGQNGPDNERYFTNGSLQWALGDTGELVVDGFYQTQDRLIPQNTAGGAQVDYRNAIEEWRLGVAPSWQLEDTRIQLNASFSRYYDQFVQDVHGTSNGDSDERTIDDLVTWGLQVDHAINRHHQLTFGLDNQLESLEADRLDGTQKRSRVGLYLQDQMGGFIEDRLQLSMGFRVDADSQFGSKLAPKISVKYQLNDHWALRSGVGSGYRAPDFKQLYLRFVNGSQGYVVAGNAELVPEESQTVNAGFDYRGDNWNWTSNAFYSDVENLIEIIEVATTTGREFTYQNVQRARLQGIENKLGIDLSERIHLRAFYNYLDAVDRDTNKALDGRAKHRLGTGVDWNFADFWAFSFDGTWVGKRNFTTSLGRPGVSVGEAESYLQADLQLSWGKSYWDVSAGLKNIFDEGDTEFLPLEPRRAYLEFTRSF